jgi:hypothetical protein
VRKGADETSNLASMTTATGLNLAVSANTAYTFSYYVLFQTAAVNTGIGLAVTTPAGATVQYTAVIPVAADGTAAARLGWGTFSGDTILGTGVEAANTTYVAHIYGVVHTGATAGNLSVQYRSELAGTNVTLKTDSWGALEVG